MSVEAMTDARENRCRAACTKRSPEPSPEGRRGLNTEQSDAITLMTPGEDRARLSVAANSIRRRRRPDDGHGCDLVRENPWLKYRIREDGEQVEQVTDSHPRDLGNRDGTAKAAGDDRDRIAENRDESSEAYDQESEARDEEAEARDKRAETREGGALVVDNEAEADRAGARRDRRGGARDRTHASHDREAALLDRLDAATDREEALAEHAFLSTDHLTGAYNRGPGYAELRREIARARGMKKPLTLAFVDVDHLKNRNDLEGHVSGDRLLRETAALIRSHFRPYDLIIRYGGDEFVCVLFDMETPEAAERFSLVSQDLEAVEKASVTVGFAMLSDDDALEDLLKRADADMYEGRRQG